VPFGGGGGTKQVLKVGGSTLNKIHITTVGSLGQQQYGLDVPVYFSYCGHSHELITVELYG